MYIVVEQLGSHFVDYFEDKLQSLHCGPLSNNTKKKSNNTKTIIFSFFGEQYSISINNLRLPNWHKENIELQAGDKYFLVHKTLEKRQFLGENKILPEVLLQVGLELEQVQPLAKLRGGKESVCLTYSLHVPYLSTLSKTFQPFAFFIILHYG